MRHILVVDDDSGVRGLMEIVIQDEGFRVTVASDIEEARRALAGGEIIFIISDEVLFGGQGSSPIDEAKARGIPFLIMTGHNDRKADYLSRGVNFLGKPFRIAELEQHIDKLIGRNEPEDRHPAGRHA
jgi:DNA-binding NtrC family response regulator